LIKDVTTLLLNLVAWSWPGVD